MKKVILMIVMFLMISCGGEEESFEMRFAETVCDIYEDPVCEFSEADREFCIDFSIAGFYNGYMEGRVPSNPEECLECFNDLGCEIYNGSMHCESKCLD